MIYVYKKILENRQDNVKLVLCVHDELHVEVTEKLAPKWKEIMNNEMIRAAKVILKTVPMVVDCKIEKCWKK